jgi:glutathione S-transferase
LKLMGGMLSPFVGRVVLAARAKDVPLEIANPEYGLKSPEYLAINPIGKMPTLIDGDFVLPESEIIAQYVDDKYSENPLMPDDATGKARVRLISRLVDAYMVPHLGGLFTATQNPDAVATTLAGLASSLDYIEHYRTPTDMYAVGNKFTLADCTLIPMFFFFDVFNAQLKTAELIAARPGLAAWWARAQANEPTQRICREMGEALQAFMRAKG